MECLGYRLFSWSYALQQSLSRRLTVAGGTILVCWVIAAVAGVDTYQTLAYQIFAFLGAVIAIAIVYSFFFRIRLTLSRTLPRFGTVGMPLQYRVLIHNPTAKIQTGLKLFEKLADPRPSYGMFRLEVQDRANQISQSEARRGGLIQAMGYDTWLNLLKQQQRARVRAIELPPLLPHSKTEIKLTLQPLGRGAVQFTGVTIARPDPFGLFQACVTFPLAQSFWILPQRYPLPPVRLPGTRRYQTGGVALASSVGDSEEFMSLRDYQPGDPLRKIHWRSWAKVGKPIVKEEQDEFFVRHALILDTFQAVKSSETLEAALSVASSFACEFQSQESLLDLMFVGTQAYCFTTGRGLGQTEQMLEILASVQACQNSTFEVLTPLVLNRTPLLSGCICIFLTWDQPRSHLVTALENLRLPTIVLVMAANGEIPLESVDPLPRPEYFYPIDPQNIQSSLNQIQILA